MDGRVEAVEVERLVIVAILATRGGHVCALSDGRRAIDVGLLRLLEGQHGGKTAVAHLAGGLKDVFAADPLLTSFHFGQIGSHLKDGCRCGVLNVVLSSLPVLSRKRHLYLRHLLRPVKHCSIVGSLRSWVVPLVLAVRV